MLSPRPLARMLARRFGLGLVAGAVLLASNAGLAAQPTRPQPTPADTVRPRQQPGDTLRRPATPDTVRARRDSVTIAAPAARDSARRASIDSVKGIPDSLKKKVRRDSIQAPLARAEVPPLIGVGPVYRWTRDSVLSTGAVSLADLLERVPGVTVFHSGFLASAQTAAYIGDFTRIRVFRDGIELDPIDPRAGSIRDVADIQLANLDEVSIERSGGEIRVHLRSWTVRNTTPSTRVDAFTGDEDTNLYRFFYGRRFGSGFAAQVGVEQFGTGSRNRRVGGGGSVLDAMGRFGWARGKWSADAVFNRLDRRRDLTTTFVGQDSLLPGSEGRRNEAYVRLGWGDPESRGLWLQAIASSTSLTMSGTGYGVTVDSSGFRASGKLATDTLAVKDSSASRRQYLLTGGYTIAGIRLSASDRVRTVRGATYNTPSARASFDRPRLSASLFAESGARAGDIVQVVDDSVLARTTKTAIVGNQFVDSLISVKIPSVTGWLPPLARRTTVDGTVRVSPLPWLAVIGSVGRSSRTLYGVRQHDTTKFNRVRGAFPNDTILVALDTVSATRAATTMRLEGALRLGRVWFSGGLLNRGVDSLLAPTVYECLRLANGDCARPAGEVDSSAASKGATGILFGMRGPFYKDVYMDVGGVGYKRSDAAYRPQYQLRSEVGVRTNWLRRFPSGNFGFKFAVIDDYRSGVRFATDTSTSKTAATLCDLQRCTAASNVLTFQLEIRIQTGILSYQFRNALNRQYEQVPGARMPGPVNYYGIRWSFWN